MTGASWPLLVNKRCLIGEVSRIGSNVIWGRVTVVVEHHVHAEIGMEEVVTVTHPDARRGGYTGTIDRVRGIGKESI